MPIVDASVATAWFVEIGTSGSARPVLLWEPLCAPSLLRIELTSSLLKYVRAGLLSDKAPLEAVENLGRIVHVWVEDRSLLPAATALALQHRHKIYDCLYLALAQQRGEPLVTANRRLAAIARELSIETELIEPSF